MKRICYRAHTHTQTETDPSHPPPFFARIIRTHAAYQHSAPYIQMQCVCHTSKGIDVMDPNRSAEAHGQDVQMSCSSCLWERLTGANALVPGRRTLSPSGYRSQMACPTGRYCLDTVCSIFHYFATYTVLCTLEVLRSGPPFRCPAASISHLSRSPKSVRRVVTGKGRRWCSRRCACPIFDMRSTTASFDSANVLGSTIVCPGGAYRGMRGWFSLFPLPACSGAPPPWCCIYRSTSLVQYVHGSLF